MKATWIYRIAAVLFVLFAVAHTIGFLTFHPPTPESRAVLDGMNSVHFQAGGQTFSYGGWYVGFGLSVTVSMLFQAFVAWYLAGLTNRQPQAIGGLGWALGAFQLPGLALSLIYFAVPPAVLSGLLTLLLGWAAWLAGRPHLRN
jgi:hypothetical protein